MNGLGIGGNLTFRGWFMHQAHSFLRGKSSFNPTGEAPRHAVACMLRCIEARRLMARNLTRIILLLTGSTGRNMRVACTPMIEVLINKESNQLAYLSKNAIRRFKTDDVIGVILGQCVFSKGGRPVGKLHHGVLRNEHGEQVARLTLQEPRSVYNIAATDSAPVWELIKQIKDHGCLLIKENKDWSNNPLEELLK